MSECQAAEDNHSSDLILLLTGKEMPLHFVPLLCGYHVEKWQATKGRLELKK